ncbi:hypothetical protein PTTG_26056 [Puccinia triticina 1-1 BBBD Race 1]|uniref:PAN2-PAN3 deadenylation complex catalytic subunit PAN2 n=1 Tax=Puccinia triticina (isolate 1-1 / race 1 (BBBD)) TaxID=630390 RepID=A0A180GZL1_PUCT1|nr:hypothetical protein PTTG_26056 [Puccinia triticina 1-1 BBBD Race 1]WAR60656.1 hypothetical protein PtB15_9B595 [Puccinia triticina]
MPSAPWKAYCNTFLGELSSLSFDPYTDLLWTANPSGTVVSHFLPTSSLPSDQDRRITRYTSFKSHTYRSSATELLLAERGVLSLADKTLKFTNRRGIPYWFLSTAFQDACSMAFTAPKSAELVVGGAKPELVLLNASTGAVVRRIDISQPSTSTLSSTQPSTGFSPTTHLRRSQSLMCCGARSGTVSLRDPVSLKEEHSMMAHYAGLEQMETEGNYLVTCGYSLKQGHPVRDPLVKVFDVRALRPLPPITFSSSPAHVRFHPRMSSTLFITSSTGQLQIIDLAQPIPTSSFYQLDVATFITDMSISSSGDGLAYVEADGLVHLWTTAVSEMDLGDESVRSNAKPIKWSRGNMPIVLPDSIEEPAPVQWTDETPLSSIGMPYYSTELFSVFPTENYITPYSPLHQRRAVPDTDLSLALQRASHHQSSNTTHEVFDGGGQKFEVQYIPNPKKTKRYQASLPTNPVVSSSGRSATARVGSPSQNLGQLVPNSKRKLSIPLFRSEKEKEKAKTLGRGKAHMDASLVGNESERDDEISFDMSLDDFHEMPKWYRQVEIKYSKFGIEDFDFGFYNNTQHSGLETHIVNSYTNSLLQVLYHTLPVRKVAESHIALSCTTPNCMLCELGFLFKMLDDAQGVNCQTSNFSRAFSINQRAIALELMDHQHQEFCLHQSQIMPRLGDQSTNTQKIPISSKSYSSLIQLCHHFLLDQIAEDASKISADHPFESLRSHPVNTQIKTTNTTTSVATISNHLLPSPIADIYTTRWQTTQSCPSCHHQISRTSFTKVIEMTYPRKALSNEPKPNTDFCSILKNSMIRETTAKSLCSNCNQYTHQRWRRQPDDLGAGNKALPAVLALNTGVTNSEQFEIWLDRRAKPAAVPSTTSKPAHLEDDSAAANDHFLQPEIGISIEPLPDLPQDTTSSRISVGDNHPLKMPPNAVVYELRGLIVQIQADDETPHLVSLIKVNNTHKLATTATHNAEEKPRPDTGAGAGSWYLFNDFLVKKVSQEEALSFPACWKVPCVLYYVRKDFEEVVDFAKLPANTVDRSILLNEINLSKCRDVNKIRHEVLTEDELPKKGDLVAIDAEFVSLQQEEVDYKSDGTRLVRRPSQMTLARVSVLRGEGSKTGVPFIDDHIQTFEPVADYLTEFSGIRPGDLDHNASPHTLVPLKVAYKKLRLLVDLGCIFIGHGLSKDFRIINIHVPPSQIIDTVDLYYIASRQRKLSLRLLSYLILRHDIQNAGTHDSIEDARTALQLYDIYRQLNNEGVWKDELESVYRKGKEMGWKVPADKLRSPLPAPAIPPVPSSAPSATAKPASTSLSGLGRRSTSVQVPRFTPSTLSAASATYFPPGGTAASNSSKARPLQPVVRQPLSSTTTTSPAVDQSQTHSEPAASFYRSIPQNAQTKASPPAPNFGHGVLGTINQTGPTPYSNTSNSRTLAATAVFQRYATAPPPVFEPKKKPPGFNPMAPSFVHSSSSSSSSSSTTSTNRPMTNSANSGPAYAHSGAQHEQKSHAGLPYHNHQTSLSHSSIGSASLPGSSLDTHSSGSSLDFYPAPNPLIGHPPRPNANNELYSFHHLPHHPHHPQHHQHPHQPPPPHGYPSPNPPPPHSPHHGLHHHPSEFAFHHHHPHLPHHPNHLLHQEHFPILSSTPANPPASAALSGHLHSPPSATPASANLPSLMPGSNEFNFVG